MDSFFSTLVIQNKKKKVRTFEFWVVSGFPQPNLKIWSRIFFVISFIERDFNTSPYNWSGVQSRKSRPKPNLTLTSKTIEDNSTRMLYYWTCNMLPPTCVSRAPTCVSHLRRSLGPGFSFRPKAKCSGTPPAMLQVLQWKALAEGVPEIQGPICFSILY